MPDTSEPIVAGSLKLKQYDDHWRLEHLDPPVEEITHLFDDVSGTRDAFFLKRNGGISASLNKSAIPFDIADKLNEIAGE